ncbi:MAG: HmuY family protein [Chitinophagaceae bacterium]
MKRFIAITLVTFALGSCKKDIDPIIIVPPSAGSSISLNGIAGTESGSAAGNSVYLDLSADRQTTSLRSSWDLGFYSGSDFRVILNNTSSAGAKVLAKNDLATVGVADTIGLILATSQTNPLPEQLVWFDEVTGDLAKTVIPAVAAVDADNKVIIVNRGTGGGIAPRPWIKLRVLRNPSGGYILQYAGIQETSFRTLQVPKDAAYNFKFVSFDNGIVDVQPEKERWDLVWTYSVFETNFGAGQVPYNFSDLVAINQLAGVTVASKTYSSAAIAAAAYSAFNRDSVATATLVNNRWAIGSGWRSTQPATGARLDRFYIIKDPNGNYYKFRCLAMGVGADGGVRGRPDFQYQLIR